MCQALLEIMGPEINKIAGEAAKEATKKAILSAVKGFRNLGADDEKIKETSYEKSRRISQIIKKISD